jgi:hypothetical protein
MAEKISKKEAVRQVVATLGLDASPTEIQKQIKERFQIEMTTGHISTTKGQLRREAASKEARPEPTAQPAREKVTKKEAVYRAVVALGQDASRGDLRDYVKKHFGYDLDPNHVSAAKVVAVRKLTAAPAPKAQPVVPTNSNSVLLADVETLRELIDKVGADNLRKLIGLITGG